MRKADACYENEKLSIQTIDALNLICIKSNEEKDEYRAKGVKP